MIDPTSDLVSVVWWNVDNLGMAWGMAQGAACLGGQALAIFVSALVMLVETATLVGLRPVWGGFYIEFVGLGDRCRGAGLLAAGQPEGFGLATVAQWSSTPLVRVRSRVRVPSVALAYSMKLRIDSVCFIN
jgi:hypothetical protein